jgi:hypothetical protein
MVGWAGKRDGERMSWMYHRKDRDGERYLDLIFFMILKTLKTSTKNHANEYECITHRTISLN